MTRQTQSSVVHDSLWSSLARISNALWRTPRLSWILDTSPQANGPTEGKYNFGNNSICLQRSRRAISVITQDPTLFTGSLRMNFDPFDENGDNELWDALEEASLITSHADVLRGSSAYEVTCLIAMVQKLSWKLSEEVREGGISFSIGERQLLCLARALLKKSRIIVMDEATANVDYETDRVIQETIRAKFKQCTVITIAHRLNTIKDYDRVLVLDDGGILGFDRPEILLEKQSYLF